MRAAYMIGREEPLKLLLNQKDPELAGRMFAYYGYFGRARAGQIHEIEENVQRLGELDSQLEAEDPGWRSWRSSKRRSSRSWKGRVSIAAWCWRASRRSRIHVRRVSSDCAVSRPAWRNC